MPETILRKKGSGDTLRTELTLPEELAAPVEQEQTVGKVSIYDGDALVNEFEVRAAADAPKLTFDSALRLLWESLVC